MLRLSLIEIMNMDLLNDFVNRIFGYRLGDNEFVYIQYKIVKGNVILNVFDNAKRNRFRAFIFTLDNIASGNDTMYINVKESYNKCYYQIVLLRYLMKNKLYYFHLLSHQLF